MYAAKERVLRVAEAAIALRAEHREVGTRIIDAMFDAGHAIQQDAR